MVNAFGEKVSKFTPSKARELPEWALKIFSPHMVAAGNIRESKELNELCFMVENNLSFYLDAIVDFHNDSEENAVKEAQNYYCEHQQQNPHTPRVMQSLGLPEDDIKLFCQDNLFPKI